MTRHQIGRSGELLVQYKLLLHGIESAPMTTDTGVDLVAFSNRNNKVITVQVKTNLKPKPAGGKGKKSWIGGSLTTRQLMLLPLLTSAPPPFGFSRLWKSRSTRNSIQRTVIISVCMLILQPKLERIARPLYTSSKIS